MRFSRFGGWLRLQLVAGVMTTEKAVLWLGDVDSCRAGSALGLAFEAQFNRQIKGVKGSVGHTPSTL